MFGLTRPVLGRIEEVEACPPPRGRRRGRVCLPVGAWDLVEPVTRLCAGEGKVVRIPGDGSDPASPVACARSSTELTVVSLVYGPDRALGLMVKRLARAGPRGDWR